MSAPASPRDEIERLTAAGDTTGAALAARRYWEASPDASVARYLRRSFEAIWQGRRTFTHRLAILRSYTLEPALPLLEAEAVLAGVQLETWISGFNTYAQEILDPASGLYAHKPDTVILALQTRDIAPALWEGVADLAPADLEAQIEAAATLLIDLLGQLRRRTDAALLCQGLEPPPVTAGGYLDLDRPERPSDAAAVVNRRVRAWATDQAGIHVLDHEGLIARYGQDRWYDDKKWATTRLPMTGGALSALAADWWRRLAVLALPPAKVLALDLDNTLWGGVLGEDGPDGIRMGAEPPGIYFRDLQRAILDIARRGVLVCLVSKNNEAEALEIIDTHPDMLLRRRHLAAWRINWATKPANLAELAEELSLGLDSFVFVDDNPAECDAVRRAHPEVEVVELSKDPSTYARVLRRLPRLERLSLSTEDAERTRFYVEERDRRDLQTSAETLEGFLGSLQIEAQVEAISPATLARAAQLTQKTNQLNLTTRRYTEAQLAAWLAEPGHGGFVLRTRDRFGDNGIVGLALTAQAGGVCEVDTLLLSCRVIGRQIETALLADLAARAREAGASVLRGWYLPTGRNAPAADIYRAAGFTRTNSTDQGEHWSLDLVPGAITAPAWISMLQPQAQPA